GVKKGDVSLDAFLGFHKVIVRAADKVILVAERKQLNAGATHTIPLRVKHFNQIAGLQFALVAAEGVRIKGITAPTLPDFDQADFGVLQEDRRIQVVWYDPSATNGAVVGERDILFNLEVDTETGMDVQEAIQLIEAPLTPLAIHRNNLRMGVDLVYEEPEDINAPDVQIRLFPNPFGEVTRIVFTASGYGQAHIFVRSLSGRVIGSYKYDYQPGSNMLDLDLVNLESGHYVISLEWEGRNQVVKAIKM
ncbi:MAG: T9SS type A sorting domain-containing protein, partial [Saprospiraceae bacterium]|nr:T9SS type A sorting domain-containing protein [Saprospiraceae bacterium]